MADPIKTPEGEDKNVGLEGLDEKSRNIVLGTRHEAAKYRKERNELRDQLSVENPAVKELEALRGKMAEAENKKLEEKNEYKPLYDAQKASSEADKLKYDNLVKAADISNKVLEGILNSRIEGLTPELQLSITNQPGSVADKLVFADGLMKQLNITPGASNQSPGIKPATTSSELGTSIFEKYKSATTTQERATYLTELKTNYPELYKAAISI